MSLSTPESVQKLQAALHDKAKKSPDFRVYALSDKVYRKDVLTFAYACCKANGGAAGVDDQTFEDIETYGAERWLDELTQELKSRTHRPLPVRRVYIPKPGGQQRPLGVPALEDKLVQRVAVEALNNIYETDFLGFSYGFRPKRSQHKALDALWCGLHERCVNWVPDLDVRSFFDRLSHEWLVRFLQHRIADWRVVGLI